MRRRHRIRAKISGTAERPRVSVYKSNRHIFVQLVNDETGKTILSSRVISAKNSKIKGTKTEKAFSVGETLAKKSIEAGIKQAVFDKGASKYHGRIKAVADGLRQGGLKV